MPEDRSLNAPGRTRIFLPGETQADYRERVATLEAEAIARRRQELSEQYSPSKTPADRIRVWERLHELPLPRSSEHRLVTVIAADTGLSLEEVRNEQRARAGHGGTAPAGLP